MWRASRGWQAASVILGTLVGLYTLAMYAPMPIYPLWLLRYILREAALCGGAVALLSAFLSSSRRGRALSLIAGALIVLPFFATLPLFLKYQVPLSLWQYFAGAPSIEVPIEKDVVLDAALPELRVDIYKGSGAAPHPFVIVIHGGSWQRGDKGDVPQVSRHLAAAGITVVDLRYRLSPAHMFPAAVQDVKCALGRLRQRSTEFGIDPKRAALLGRSAGGQLALLGGYSTAEASLPPACAVPDEPVQAVVAIYPFTDLRAAHEHPPSPDPEETRPVLEAHLGGSPSALPAVYARATPQTFVAPLPGRVLPPTLFLHGKSDMLVPLWHSEKLYQALRAIDQSATLVAIPLHEHGFDFRGGGAGEQLERTLVTRFLQNGRL